MNQTANRRPDTAALAALTQPLTKATVTDPIISGGTNAGNKDKRQQSGQTPATQPKAGHSGIAGDVRRRPGRVSKITVRLDSDLVGRARAAWLYDGVRDGIPTFSDWVAGAIEAQVLAAEVRTNGGQTFEALEAGALPTGRAVR